MYELVRVNENCAYIQSPAKIGLITTEDGCVHLIDSGSDKDAGKKVKRQIDSNGWKLEAIYNTHSHADHIGGNQYLQKQTGCRIYAPGIERDFTEHPILEPSFLYGGNPPGELRHKFLMAQPSEVYPLTADVLPEKLEMLPLPGHSWSMVGFRYEGVVYLADCLSSKETLEKYQVSFIVDIGQYISTLEMVEKLDAELFIPSHAEMTDNIAPLARYNIEKVNEIAETIHSICSSACTFETVLKRVFEHYDLVMTMEQHFLVGSTVKSYLSYLKETERLESFIEKGYLLFRSR